MRRHRTNHVDDDEPLTPEQVSDRNRYAFQAKAKVYLIIFGVMLAIAIPLFAGALLVSSHVLDRVDTLNTRLDTGLDNGAKTRALECRILLRMSPTAPLPAICRDPLVERYLLDPNVAGEPVPTTQETKP